MHVHPERSIAQKRKFYSSDVCSDELATTLYLPQPLTNQKGQKEIIAFVFSAKELSRFLFIIYWIRSLKRKRETL